MKSHHAAALALLGWYLMIPPPKFDPDTHLPIPGRADTDETSFMFWRTEGNFDSVQECETARRQLLRDDDRLDAEMRTKHPEWFTKEREEAWDKQQDREMKVPKGYHHALRGFGRVADANAECVATDDPRLKEK